MAGLRMSFMNALRVAAQTKDAPKEWGQSEYPQTSPWPVSLERQASLGKRQRAEGPGASDNAATCPAANMTSSASSSSLGGQPEPSLSGGHPPDSAFLSPLPSPRQSMSRLPCSVPPSPAAPTDPYTVHRATSLPRSHPQAAPSHLSKGLPLGFSHFRQSSENLPQSSETLTPPAPIRVSTIPRVASDLSCPASPSRAPSHTLSHCRPSSPAPAPFRTASSLPSSPAHPPSQHPPLKRRKPFDIGWISAAANCIRVPWTGSRSVEDDSVLSQAIDRTRLVMPAGAPSPLRPPPPYDPPKRNADSAAGSSTRSIGVAPKIREHVLQEVFEQRKAAQEAAPTLQDIADMSMCMFGAPAAGSGQAASAGPRTVKQEPDVQAQAQTQAQAQAQSFSSPAAAAAAFYEDPLTLDSSPFLSNFTQRLDVKPPSSSLLSASAMQRCLATLPPGRRAAPSPSPSAPAPAFASANAPTRMASPSRAALVSNSGRAASPAAYMTKPAGVFAGSSSSAPPNAPSSVLAKGHQVTRGSPRSKQLEVAAALFAHLGAMLAQGDGKEMKKNTAEVGGQECRSARTQAVPPAAAALQGAPVKAEGYPGARCKDGEVVEFRSQAVSGGMAYAEAQPEREENGDCKEGPSAAASPSTRVGSQAKAPPAPLLVDVEALTALTGDHALEPGAASGAAPKSPGNEMFQWPTSLPTPTEGLPWSDSWLADLPSPTLEPDLW